VSGTAKQNPVSRKITMIVEVVGDATNNAASVTIALSPDNTTYTTIATPAIGAAVNNLAAVAINCAVTLPQGWWIKLTIGAHATVAASIYY
jgi:polygalacturonase